MQNVWQDLRYAARTLLARPGFTSIALVTLALGIGANSAIFSVTDKLLIRSLAVKDPDNLVLVNSESVSPYFLSNAFSYPNFSDYRAQNQVFSGLLAFTQSDFEMVSGERTERVKGEYVSGNYFDVLGIRVGAGRTFLPDEDVTPGTQPVVVVSEAFARKRFGATASAIGQILTLNGIPLTVIGIAPRSFNGMILEEPTEIWVPVLMHPQLERSKFISNRSDGFLLLLGRVRDGLSQQQAESEMDLVARQIKDANTPPGTITKGMPFSEQHIKFEAAGRGISLLRKKFSAPLKVLMAAVALVLLIGSTNVAGLLLARGSLRRKELAIRLALGASRWRIARHLLTESLLLAAAGGAAALLVAPWLVTLLLKTQSRLNVAETLLGEGVDRRVLAFTALATLVTAIVFGVAPALQGSRTDLVPALKDAGEGAGRGWRRLGFRRLLVIGQIALSIVVLIGAGLCVRSLRNLLAIEPGFQAERLLIVPVDLDSKKYSEAQGRVLQQQIIERLGSLPGVESVSYGLVMPFSGSRYMSSIFVEGRQPLPDEQMAFDTNTVGPRYHETMGIPIVEGRGFTEQDRTGTPGVVVINEALASRLFPGEDALGKRLRFGPGAPSLEIIGIARDIKHHDLTESPVPHFDLPALQRGYEGYTNFVARSKGPSADLVLAARTELTAVDSSLPVDWVTSMSAQLGKGVAGIRLASTLSVIFGLVALILAAIGLYGLMSHAVSGRTREIGIRMALGAYPAKVLRLVIRQGMLLTAAGIGLGLAAALICTRLIESVLYGIGPEDPLTFAIVALVLPLIALLACYVPARRASRVDPMMALRNE
ncbi:MAG TPA: ABC transporter permease [Blastocatellia bacterium]|nr:ABC transporter permease [Blastocatellia bacterium]